MKLFRKILFWCHLIIGVTAGIIVLIMSVTGVLLTYERQITYWADTRGYAVAPPSTGAQRLSTEALIASAREKLPDTEITTLTLRSDVTAPAAISFTTGGQQNTRTNYFNPYTGDLLGEGSKKVRDFFRFNTDWHRWLGAQGENRTTARAITGACNLGFLFLVASGFYLWWPKKWNWRQFKSILWFKRKLPGKARDFNWHNVIGFWSVVPLFIVVLSGVVISYTWAGNLVYRAAGENPPPPRAPGPPQGQPAQGTAPAPNPAAKSLEGFDELWSRAEQQSSSWKIISLRLPSTEDAPAVFTIDEGDGGQPQKRAQLTLDRKSGDVVKWEPFSTYTKGRQWRSYLRFAHTGEVAGIIGQTIAGLASLGGIFLVYTGLALSWRRFRDWRARRARSKVYATPNLSEPIIESSVSETQVL